MLGVFVDTIVICTASAAMIMLSGVMDMPDAGKGISLLSRSITRVRWMDKHTSLQQLSCYSVSHQSLQTTRMQRQTSCS